jgi:hypothetical protein
MVNLYEPLDDTDSGSDSLFISVRLPPERPDTVPPIENADGGLGLELEEPPQLVSCNVKRLSRTKPKSFTTSWLTCAPSFVMVLNRENCLAVGHRVNGRNLYIYSAIDRLRIIPPDPAFLRIELGAVSGWLLPLD